MTDQIFRATMPVEYLAVSDEDSAKGIVRAKVSAFGVKYRIGLATWHTIDADAFAGSVDDAVPLFWQHGWAGSDQFPIGHGDAEQADDGLIVDGALYIDQKPIAGLHRAMKAGAIKNWSIGYRVLATRVDEDDESHQFITEAELLEASSVLRGANPDTETLEVASAFDVSALRSEFDKYLTELADIWPAPDTMPTQRLELLAHAGVRKICGD